MKVLGIDPGSRVTGLGLVDAGDDAMRCLFHRSVRTGNGELGERLRVIFEAVTEAVETHRPDVVAIEQVFVGQNVRSALVLGHARGSALCAAVTRALPVAEYSPRQVKLAVVGSGGASKEQVQHMVRILLGMTTPPPADAADALACAICHVHNDAHAARLASHGRAQ